MNDFTRLREFASPPSRPVLGDQVRANRALQDFGFQYPSEFWEIADAYGSGSFFDEYRLMLLCPSVPSFTFWFAWAALNFPGSVTVESGLEVNDWLPVAIDGEFVLLISRDGAADSCLLFLCVASQDEYEVFDMSLAKFILDYSTPEMQQRIYGDSAFLPQEGQFNSESELWVPSREKVRQMAKQAGLARYQQLENDLSQSWPPDLP